MNSAGTFMLENTVIRRGASNLVVCLKIFYFSQWRSQDLPGEGDANPKGCWTNLPRGGVGEGGMLLPSLLDQPLFLTAIFIFLPIWEQFTEFKPNTKGSPTLSPQGPFALGNNNTEYLCHQKTGCMVTNVTVHT